MADAGGAAIAVAPGEGAPAGGPHPGQLSRVLHVPGTIAIVVSAVTPAASVFIIAPVAFLTVGTGTSGRS